MKKSHKILAVILTCLSLFGLSIFTTAPAFADYKICEDSTVPESVKQIYGCESAPDDRLASVIVGILNGIIGAAGLVAVIFIIIGGINYMTSAGDSSKVEKGKKTIIYAAIGLVICALSFAIVNWVILGALDKPVEDTPASTGYIVLDETC